MLVVEDGTGLATAESYASVAEADAYHTKMGNTAWAGDTTTVKEPALRKAAQYLDGKYGRRFEGVRLNGQQALAWPRIGVYDSDGYAVSGTSVPKAVKDAASEAALRALSGELSPDVATPGSILSKDVVVGPIEKSVTYSGGASQLPAYTVIDRLLYGLVGPPGMVTMERA